MGLRLKFNLVLFLVFVLGLGVSGYVSYDLLHKTAREEVLRNAGVMMEAALSMRQYTVSQVRDKLVQKEDEFLPQSVPAFAATEIMNQLRKKYPDYAYKEAALNPTNPRDRAVEWEADIVNEFRNNSARGEISGTRLTPTGMSLFLARPFQIKDPACLSCHTTAEMAPASMVKLYGTNNGFGWKLNEVIGAQVVSVPMAVPVARATQSFRTFMLSLLGVFALVIVLLNVMLYLVVVKRVTRLAKIANQVSLGNMEAGDFKSKSKDEIGVLTDAMGRMKASVVQAMNMLDGSK